MLATVNGIPVHYAQHGTGTPVLALHGAGVDHREISGYLEPLFADRAGYRRVYPDLPGMGRTPAPETIDSNDAVLDTLLGLVDAVIGGEELLVRRPLLRRLPGPGVELADQAALARIFERWRLRTVPEQGPAYANPRATFAVLDRAGHGLLHEQVGLGTALLAEWLDRVREHRATMAAGNERGVMTVSGATERGERSSANPE